MSLKARYYTNFDLDKHVYTMMYTMCSCVTHFLFYFEVSILMWVIMLHSARLCFLPDCLCTLFFGFCLYLFDFVCFCWTWPVCGFDPRLALRPVSLSMPQTSLNSSLPSSLHCLLFLKFFHTWQQIGPQIINLNDFSESLSFRACSKVSFMRC